MFIKPFSDTTTDIIVLNQKKSIQNKINGFTNEEIVANDIEILAENLYQEFFIYPVIIHEEDYEKRAIRQEKVSKYVDSFTDGYPFSGNVDVDGVIVEFYYPFDGTQELFKCRANTYILGAYPKIEISNGYVIFRISKTIDEAKHIGKDKLISEIESSLRKIQSGIAYVNNDINQFNSGLKLFIWKLLNEKRAKVDAFFDFAKRLEVPIEKREYAITHIPIQRKIIPISHKYDREAYYSISDSEYKDILDSIKHTATTYERTPGSYKSMQEEDLRNTLLAALNATYKGNATGETFRNKGKTDICIEQENRSAFIAECKMWTGQKEVKNAIHQLDGYLTWRDCKTALIYFVRRKDFVSVLGKAKDTLCSIDGMKMVKDVDKNEFDCSFLSETNTGQIVKIRVLLFNLFSE